jgi:hypothetical protein
VLGTLYLLGIIGFILWVALNAPMETDTSWTGEYPTTAWTTAPASPGPDASPIATS